MQGPLDPYLPDAVLVAASAAVAAAAAAAAVVAAGVAAASAAACAAVLEACSAALASCLWSRKAAQGDISTSSCFHLSILLSQARSLNDFR